jgi:glycosyltransferase involved in cell wall biosynthesis
MHIALVHHHVGGKAGGGGGVRLMLELGTGLVARGHRVTVACHDFLPGSEFSYASDQLEIRSVRRGVSSLPAGNKALMRRYWLDMPKVARLIPPDATVVNAHEWLALRAGRMAAGRLSIPLVWTRNDESPWEALLAPRRSITGDRPLPIRAAQAILTWPDVLDARRASAIAVLSASQVDVVRRCDHRNAFVVPVGPAAHFFDPPDRDTARARLGVPEDAFLVVGSGILVKHRRFEDLIDAMPLLTDDPQVHMLLAGSDHVDPQYADSLERRIAARGVGARVTLPRRSLSEGELKDMYVAADVFVLLSQRYAWGLAPLEAIASGTPVVITPGAGVYDILSGRPGVQVVPAQDPAALAMAIRRWRSVYARGTIEPTRAWLHQEFSLDSYVSRMEQIYTDVVDVGPRDRVG